MVQKDHISTGMLLKITRLDIWRIARATHDATSTMCVVGICVCFCVTGRGRGGGGHASKLLRKVARHKVTFGFEGV